MKFTKIQTCGRDYILINKNREGISKNFSDLSRYLCNRYFGIGASSAVFFEQQNNTFSIEVFSPKGEKIDFDASAAVCIAVYASTINGKIQHSIIQGENTLNIIVQKEKTDFCITADLGKGTFLPHEIDLASNNPVINKGIEVGNRILTLTGLKLGNVFAVHETQFSDKLNFLTLGEQITKHSLFKKKASACFAEILSENTLFLSSYINPTGFVLSDISAAGATVLSLCRTNLLSYNKEITVKSEGGEIFVYTRKNNSVLINTNANIIFEGTV